MRIHSVKDLETYVSNYQPDFAEVYSVKDIAEQIRSCEHPIWGDDWSEYLSLWFTEALKGGA